MKAELLYEGKAKKVYRKQGTTDQLILSYKNDATAFNGKKKESFDGKGQLNNKISARIFHVLHEKGVKTHFIEQLNETEQLVYETAIVPLEVVVRNIAAGSIVKRLGLAEKLAFEKPLVELFYKNDALNDPLINDEHAYMLTGASDEELDAIKAMALTINGHLIEMFAGMNVTLADFKLEFGKLADGTIVLADEISPDTCRLWDKTTGEKLDKDVFRQGIGDLLTGYNIILQRMEAMS